MKVVSRLLLDTSAWMYYFAGATEHLGAISRLVETCVALDVELLYAPTGLRDVFDLVPRALARADVEGRDASAYVPAAWACVRRMMELATAAPLGASECETARTLRDQLPDLGCGLVIAAADGARADYVVTYDDRLLAAVPEECATAERVLELMQMGRRA